jgi:hypothetical protein
MAMFRWHVILLGNGNLVNLVNLRVTREYVLAALLVLSNVLEMIFGYATALAFGKLCRLAHLFVHKLGARASVSLGQSNAQARVSRSAIISVNGKSWRHVSMCVLRGRVVEPAPQVPRDAQDRIFRHAIPPVYGSCLRLARSHVLLQVAPVFVFLGPNNVPELVCKLVITQVNGRLRNRAR